MILGKDLHPDVPFDTAVARNSVLLGSNPGRVRCLLSRFFTSYTVFQTVQRPVVCGDVYCTVHYTDPLKLR